VKVIAIAAVSGGGKTRIVSELSKTLENNCILSFDDYVFEGEVEDYHKWVIDGADYTVWNLEPLLKDIIKIKAEGKYDYLLLDYPFAYKNNLIKSYIDYAIFIDTPLDIAMGRRILRDMSNSSGDDIREEIQIYLKYARIAYIQMLKDILPSSDYVIDGAQGISEIVGEIKCRI